MLFLPIRHWLYAIGCIVYFAVFFKNAWVGDDAYILFRSLEQLLDGNGPRWNPHERVQVFTCPLWYGLLAVMGSFSRDHYLNSILLSAICNALLLWNLGKILKHAGLWLLAVLALTLSQAYFDFTSSGLENPLVYCLLTTVLRFHFDDQLPQQQRLLYIGIAAGLLLITRHDSLLFIVPLLAYHTGQQGKNSAALLTATALPLALWTLFSLLYYGFPLPNTAYAKLGDLLPRELLLQRGLLYFSTSITRDLISIFLLLAGIVLGLCRSRPLQLIALGVLLHLAYVVWIGGDFMRGRFFGWDVLLCTIVLLYPTAHQNRKHIAAAVTGLIGVGAVSGLLQTPPLATPIHWGAEPFRMGDSADGVTQERFFFFWFTRFTRYLQHGPRLIEDFGWCQDGLEQKRQGIPLAASNTIGMHGFCLGTDGIVIDFLGITDPLLARMPHNPAQTNWRAGHFQRLAPSGYCNSILQHKNLLEDPAAAHYYDTMRLITQSEPLLAPARLQAIWQINTGALRQEQIAAQQTLLQQAAQLKTEGKKIPGFQPDCTPVSLPEQVIERLKHPTP
ncbi:MAG: hypothetical protein IT470_07365 [Pseudomonadales bacterium]|nr:hypothetical protein [Pseudomonadales bacterium]